MKSYIQNYYICFTYNSYSLIQCWNFICLIVVCFHYWACWELQMFSIYKPEYTPNIQMKGWAALSFSRKHYEIVLECYVNERRRLLPKFMTIFNFPWNCILYRPYTYDLFKSI